MVPLKESLGEGTGGVYFELVRIPVLVSSAFRRQDPIPLRQYLIVIDPPKIRLRIRMHCVVQAAASEGWLHEVIQQSLAKNRLPLDSGGGRF